MINTLCRVCKEKCKQQDYQLIIKCPHFVHSKTGTKSGAKGLLPKGKGSVLGIQRTIASHKVG